MNRRIYKKDVNCFLKQPFHENILPKLQSTKKNSDRRKRPLSNNSFIKADEGHLQPKTPLFGKLSRMKKVELDISNEFWNKDKALKADARGYPYKVELRSKTDTALLLSIEQVRNILVSKRIERQTRSELRNQILESRKVRLLYGGLSKKELKKSIGRSKQLSGNTGDNLFVLLESRLDVVLERCGFFSSIQAARQSVVHKRVYVNSRIVTKPGCQLKSGDVIQVYPSKAPLPSASVASRKPFLKESSNKNMSIQAKSYPAAPAPYGAGEQPKAALQSKQAQVSYVCNPNATLESQASAWAFTVPPATLRSLLQLESALLALGEVQLSPAPYGAGEGAGEGAGAGAGESCATKRSPPTHKKKSNTSLSGPNLNTFGEEISIDVNIKNDRFECFSKEQIKNLTSQLAQIVQNSELNCLLKGKDERKTFNLTVEEIANAASQNSALEAQLSSDTNATFFHIRKENGFSYSVDNTLSLYSGASHNTVLVTEERKEQGLRIGRMHRRCAYKAIATGENIKSRPLNLILKEKIVDMPLNDSFYNTYSYWLEVKKRLLAQKSSEEWRKKSVTKTGLYRRRAKDQAEAEEMASLWNSSNLVKMIKPLFSTQRSSQEKKSKPLHLELSYQSHTAIFLYAPQRVYLSALVDVDLLVKSL